MIDDMPPAEFVRRQDAGEPWQLLDVREPWEIDIARIDGSIYIPMNQVPDRHHELDASMPVAVLCHSGGRSVRVATYLAQQGFDRVTNITGGIDSWSIDVDTSIPRY